MPPPDEAGDEQSLEERREIARRYRARRGTELRELAGRCVDGDVEAAGEFGTVPTEALAAIPGLGMLLLPLARRRSRRAGLPPKLLLALDADHLYAIGQERADLRREGIEVEAAETWSRSDVSIERSGRVFMRDRLLLNVPDRSEPITLYATSLITNPWSAAVVRALGGEAPDPLDLDA